MRTLAVAALVVLAILPTATASPDDWSDDARSLEVDAQSDGFELRSERVADEVRDRIRLRLEGDNVRFRFEFQRDVASTEVDAELRVELERVVEFRDQDADGAFGGADDVRAEYGPSDLVLTSVLVENISAAGVPGLRVTATYGFRDLPASSLTFRVAAFGDLTAFQDLVQHPVEVKADIELSDLLQEAGTLPGIVLRIRAASPSPPNVTAQGVSIEVDGLSAAFRWKDTATVDGNETRVGVTVTENAGTAGERDLTVAFAYARGARIVHDPTFGFLRGITQALARVLGDVGLYAIGALGAGGVFGGLALARRGRKVKRE